MPRLLHSTIRRWPPTCLQNLRKRYLLLKKNKLKNPDLWSFNFRRSTCGCSYIWSQGVGYGMASRAGDGSLTKTSPLHVVDQMACLEGGPWIPLESQQDTLNKASLRARGGEMKNDFCSSQSRFRVPSLHTQSCISSSVAAASLIGHLCLVRSGV